MVRTSTMAMAMKIRPSGQAAEQPGASAQSVVKESRALGFRERGHQEGVRRRRRSSAGRGRGHRVLSVHRADGGTARRDAAA